FLSPFFVPSILFVLFFLFILIFGWITFAHFIDNASQGASFSFFFERCGHQRHLTYPLRRQRQMGIRDS
ncbi:hypothetical protein C4813_23815, partial [Salmonella enterica subsp. enterica serovar Rubislaw]|uniref:hypothetical protein n=1 Tax=Salmonella enterica TaxID=28901 RepID=UPI000D61DB34